MAGQWQPPSALPLSSHINFAVQEEEEKPLDQYSPLDGEGHDEDADGHAAWAVAAEERHEEPEAQESLEVDIPETWRRRGRRTGLLPAGPPGGA